MVLSSPMQLSVIAALSLASLNVAISDVLAYQNNTKTLNYPSLKESVNKVVILTDLFGA